LVTNINYQGLGYERNWSSNCSLNIFFCH